jgi:hypothetical protein
VREYRISVCRSHHRAQQPNQPHGTATMTDCPWAYGPQNRMRDSAQGGDWLRILRLRTLTNGSMAYRRNSLPVPSLSSSVR